MPTIINNLLPFRQYDETDVTQLFALGGVGTGVAGLLLSPVNFNPDSGDGYTTIQVGASYPLVNSPRYATTPRAQPSVSGDTKFTCLGIQLLNVQEYDENGEILRYHPELIEKVNCVLSGQSVPIARKGIFALSSRSYNISVPQVGYAMTVSNSGNGTVDFVAANQIVQSGVLSASQAATGAYQPFQVVGKCISTSGSHFSGYAIVILDLP